MATVGSVLPQLRTRTLGSHPENWSVSPLPPMQSSEHLCACVCACASACASAHMYVWMCIPENTHRKCLMVPLGESEF